MKRVVAVIAVGLFAAACASHTDLQRPATQDDFGVQMAKMNLWREAMFRFKRAVQINPSDALAHNNLAVAYEAVGDFENARKEYLEALKLDRTNSYIQKNYSRFVEFLSRNRKRQQTTSKSAAPANGAAPASASSTTTKSAEPDRPVGADVPPTAAVNPPGAQPSDRPQPPTTTTPPPQKPPGGAV